MTTVLVLIIMALIGLFGGKAQGCSIALLFALLIVVVFSSMDLVGKIIIGIVCLIIFPFAVYARMKGTVEEEKEKFGTELSEPERKRIQEIGEEEWVNEQTGPRGVGIYQHYYTEYKKQGQKKSDAL